MSCRVKEYRDQGSNTDDLLIEEPPDGELERGSNVKDGSHPKFGQAITAQLAALRNNASDDDDDDDWQTLHTDSSGNDDPTFYDCLGVEPTATRRVIKKAFKAKVAELKLEREAATTDEDWDLAHAQVKNLEDMYRTLREDATREEYDRSIGLSLRENVPTSREEPNAGLVEEIDEQATGQLTLVEAGASNLATITEGVVLTEVAEVGPPVEGRNAGQTEAGESQVSPDADNRRLQVATTRSVALKRQNGHHDDQQPVRSGEETMTIVSQQRDVVRQVEVPSRHSGAAPSSQDLSNSITDRLNMVRKNLVRQNMVHQSNVQGAPISGQHTATSTSQNALVKHDNNARLPLVSTQPLRPPNPPPQMPMHVQHMHNNPNGMMVPQQGQNGWMMQNRNNRVGPPAPIPPNFGQTQMMGGVFNPMAMAMNPASSSGFTFSRTRISMTMNLNTGATSGSHRSQTVVRNSEGQIQMDSDEREFERR